MCLHKILSHFEDFITKSTKKDLDLSDKKVRKEYIKILKEELK